MHSSLITKLIAAAGVSVAVLSRTHAAPVSLRALRKMVDPNVASLAKEAPSSNELGTSIMSQAQELDRFNAEAALGATPSRVPETSSVLQEAPPATSAKRSASATGSRKSGRKKGGKNFQGVDFAKIPRKKLKLLQLWSNVPIDKIPLRFAFKVEDLREQYYKKFRYAQNKARYIPDAERALLKQRRRLIDKRRRLGGQLGAIDSSRLDDLNGRIKRIRAQSVESQDVPASTSIPAQLAKPVHPAEDAQRTSSRPWHLDIDLNASPPDEEVL